MASQDSSPPAGSHLGPTTRTALLALGVAGFLGVLFDQLAFVEPVGLGLTLALVALALSTLAIARARRLELGTGAWLAVPICLAAACLSLRASPTLIALNILVIGICGALFGHRLRGGRLSADGLSDHFASGVLASVFAGLGAGALLFMDTKWRELASVRWTRVALPGLRGVLIAGPLVLVVGARFMAADQVFERLVLDTLRIDFAILGRDCVLSATLAWVLAGLLRQALLSRVREPLNVACPRALTVGMPEAIIVLSLLDALFLLFVIVQIGWFFGGNAYVQANESITYSEYARRGFGELVTAAGLVLPLLLLADWMTPRAQRREALVFGALAMVLIGLLFVIMASAVNRMLIYQAAYGLTEQRLYPTAFMLWLAIVFAWFVATVLRGRRSAFAVGMLVSGLAVAGALNAINPDALIVQVNSERQNALTAFDTRYANSLSADAGPAVVAALPRLSPAAQSDVARNILVAWGKSGSRDWRTWNLGRTALAWTAADNQARLEQLRDRR